jgi:hypothetical protein
MTCACAFCGDQSKNNNMGEYFDMNAMAAYVALRNMMREVPNEKMEIKDVDKLQMHLHNYKRSF